MRFGLVLWVLVAAGCGPQTDTDTQRLPGSVDAGTSAVEPLDSGVPPASDTGSSSDTGSQAPDAGAPAPDSGSEPVADVGAPSPADAGVAPENDAPEYRERGQIDVQREELRVQATQRCTMTAVRFTPTTPIADGYALVLHGFSRGRAQFLGWGEHLASHGIETVVSDLCHASISGVDPVAGGEAIDTLIQNIGDEPVVIVGHSAGSMAALVAGSRSDSTVAVLGLDPVAPNEGDLSADATELDGMLAGLIGDPSQCNSNNSGVDVYRQGNAQMLSVAGATHCDFEAPTNFLCTATCGGSGGESVQASIRQLATAFVAWKLGVEAAASWWNESSSALDDLIESGQVRPVR